MNLFTCHICNHQHEVFSLVDTKGKPKLCFTCDGVEARSYDKTGHVILRTVTETFPYTGPKLTGPFREVWSARLVKRKAGENQFQLPLMRQ